MLLHFDKIPETSMPNPRGGQGEMISRIVQDGDNKIMYARLTPGSSIGLHTHERDSEVVYILSGAGKALYGGEYEPLSPGSCHYCPKGRAHSLINDGAEDLVFLAVIPVHNP